MYVVMSWFEKRLEREKGENRCICFDVTVKETVRKREGKEIRVCCDVIVHEKVRKREKGKGYISML